MKLLALIVPLTLILLGCQSGADTTPTTTPGTPGASAAQVPMAPAAKGSKAFQDRSSQKTSAASRPLLALTSNGLQVVSQPTGATTEIPFGRPLEPLVETVNMLLGIKAPSVGVNGECGAGPLKMAAWRNGLTLVFQEKRTKRAALRGWQFVGWHAGVAADGTAPRVTTMAGIGVGSTRAELESAYTIKAFASTLGAEFSTSSGLYGLFAGPGKDARITSLWSGTSCNFR